MSLSTGGNIKNPFSLRKAPTIHPEVLESVLGVAQVLYALGRYGSPIKSYATLGSEGPGNGMKQSSVASIESRDASVMDHSSLGTWKGGVVLVLLTCCIDQNAVSTRPSFHSNLLHQYPLLAPPPPLTPHPLPSLLTSSNPSLPLFLTSSPH